ncbi:MAG: MFS transporter [Candidatus Aminicenantales bacterium]
MAKRTPFPPVFWVANSVEVLERFAYYGIYMGFGIYMSHLGYSKSQLGIVQTIFILVSYMIPIISGTFADRYGFKKVLIVSYLAYLPSILLLLVTRSFSGIALTMLSIGLAAGIFKPLISGTVRAVTDRTNKTLGFGIFYQMVNLGASFGPLIAGKLRVVSWNYAFLMAAIGIGVMLLITILFYREPKREIEGITLRQKFADLGVALSDAKFLFFLILLGLFFWIPFWGFFNMIAMYIDLNLDTARLYLDIKSVPLIGAFLAHLLSRVDDEGVRRIIGETIGHTGYIIMIFQFIVSRVFEKLRAISTFLFGMFVAAAGLMLIGLANVSAATWVFLGIFLFALGEMISSPRIQEYITWLAPKEKAGLYMGANFLAVGLGAFSGLIYQPLFELFTQKFRHPEYIWYLVGAHLVVGILVFILFTTVLGEFREREV